MNRAHVEETFGKYGVKPVTKQNRRNADIYIGEGYANAWLDYPNRPIALCS